MVCRGSSDFLSRASKDYGYDFLNQKSLSSTFEWRTHKTDVPYQFEHLSLRKEQKARMTLDVGCLKKNLNMKTNVFSANDFGDNVTISTMCTDNFSQNPSVVSGLFDSSMTPAKENIFGSSCEVVEERFDSEEDINARDDNFVYSEEAE